LFASKSKVSVQLLLIEHFFKGVTMRLRILGFAFAVALAGLSNIASATTVYFDSTECATCTNMGSVSNEWSSFGLSVNNAYWYTDSRDTFDGMGLSNGSVETLYSPGVTASLNFASATNSAGIIFDYLVLAGNTGIYQAYDSLDNLLGSLTASAGATDLNGTYSFAGQVSRLDWVGNGGFADLSTVTFNTPVAPVPEPETYAMLLVGLGLIGFMARRREGFNFVV
jgi:hypothetical protein